MQKQIKLVRNSDSRWALYIENKRVMESLGSNIPVEKVLHQLTEHGVIASMEVWRYDGSQCAFGEFPLEFDETDLDMHPIKRHEYIAA